MIVKLKVLTRNEVSFDDIILYFYISVYNFSNRVGLT